MAPPGYRNLLRRYERYAPDYDRRFSRYSEGTLSKALQLTPDIEGELLDVACGTGLFEIKLRAHRPQLRITGIDISPQMLERARQRFDGDDSVTFLSGTAERLPVLDASFDIIACNNAFHLVQDAPAALVEFHRVLKPGGTLVIVDWCTDRPSMRLRAAVMKLVDRHPRNLRRVDELATLVQQAGFSIELRDQFTAPGHWGMLVVRARAAATAQPATQLQGSRTSIELSAGTV